MPMGTRINRYIPYISLGVATTALFFQTLVLYPWHYELDDGFHRLKDEQMRMLKEFHEIKLKRLEDLEKKISQSHEKPSVPS